MKELKDISSLLENTFGLTKASEDTSLLSESEYLILLRNRLSERVLFYLRTNVEILFQALYRIDVNDRYVNEAFDLGEIHLVSKKIAELIIERQLQKLSYIYKFS